MLATFWRLPVSALNRAVFPLFGGPTRANDHGLASPAVLMTLIKLTSPGSPWPRDGGARLWRCPHAPRWDRRRTFLHAEARYRRLRQSRARPGAFRAPPRSSHARRDRPRSCAGGRRSRAAPRRAAFLALVTAKHRRP